MEPAINYCRCMGVFQYAPVEKLKIAAKPFHHTARAQKMAAVSFHRA